MSGSGCMALKMSCESERTVRGLKMTRLHTDYLPFLTSFCTNLTNQHRLCYRAFTSNSRLTLQVRWLELPLKFLYESLTLQIPPSAWLTRQVLGRKLISKHWKRSLFILLSPEEVVGFEIMGHGESLGSNLRLSVGVAHIVWSMHQPRLPMQITSIRVSLLVLGQGPGDRGAWIKLFPRKDKLKLVMITNV